jgi:hypothetical protein
VPAGVAPKPPPLSLTQHVSRPAMKSLLLFFLGVPIPLIILFALLF